MVDSFSLRDKVALITGAGGGVGAAIALAFAAAGADLALNDLGSNPALTSLAAQIARMGRQALPVPADVGDPAAVTAMVEQTVARFGRIDVLINNAGIMTDVPFEQLSIEEWDRLIAVDLRSVFLCSRAVLPDMLARGSGVIINVSSQLGQRGAPRLVHYCAAKGGVLAFTRALAQEVGTRGVRVNAIAPGPLDTPLTQPYATPDWLVAKAAQNVLGRLGSPEEIAPTAVFLASDAASFYIGQTLYPNGGGVML